MLFSLRRAPEDAARVLINLADVYRLQGLPGSGRSARSRPVGIRGFRFATFRARSASSYASPGWPGIHRRLSSAIDTVRAALGLLGPGADLRLHVAGHYNLTFYLMEAGRFEEAAELLEADRGLYEKVQESWLQLRLTWIRGDLAAVGGDFARAEQAYLEARNGFIGQGIDYDAAMASLDLANLYLKEGRMADVQRLAEEVLPIFQAQDVHREALAALQLFQKAAAERS